MAIRLIGLALALPSSSYFSNYEVFIAERRISKVASQLIKLVYVSLPYQRRLSEYGLSNSRVYKLRVSRDRTCDESLLQMTWPETDPHPGSQSSTDSPGLAPMIEMACCPVIAPPQMTTGERFRGAANITPESSRLAYNFARQYRLRSEKVWIDQMASAVSY